MLIYNSRNFNVRVSVAGIWTEGCGSCYWNVTCTTKLTLQTALSFAFCDRGSVPRRQHSPSYNFKTAQDTVIKIARLMYMMYSPLPTSNNNNNLYFKRVTPITIKSILPSGPLKTNYNIARVLALYKSYWAAMNKIFIYARPCVNKMTWAFFFLPGCKVVVF